MTKKIYIILILGLLVTILGCRTSRGFSTTFYEGFSGKPQEVVDSITTANSLPAFTGYREWPKSMYLTSDSAVTTQYTAITSKVDTTYVFSITEVAGDSIYLIKFRKE